MRTSGILMHITSLPGKYGVGTMGQQAYAFVDFLKKAGQSYWQILPLTPTSYGDSPYQSCSTFAGNHYLIDLEQLMEDGLLTQADLEGIQWNVTDDKADFGLLYQNRLRALRTAYGRFVPDEAYARFCEENSNWLPDFTLFMALKDKFGGKPWYEWEDKLKFRDPDAIWQARNELKAEAGFFSFVQYLFFKQWNALHAYANQNNIFIIGDVPIYVPRDSVEAWSSPELFQMDEKLDPTAVAGCPPDAFAADGQLWGNPLYDWPVHKATGFAWWKQRMKHATSIYDVVRIDHFRGFDTYWAIPADSTTARTGKWENGPGMELFDALEQALGQLPIIAEDLGELFPSVRKLLADSTFPGMKVLQFAFSGGDNEYLPHNHVKNSVVYPGTHDNTTLTDWWENGASEKEKAAAAAYLHLTGVKPTAKELAAIRTDDVRIALLRAALGSVADRAIIPMYDWLGLGAEAHLNTPGKLGGNWAWRAADGFAAKALAKTIHDECSVYCRV